MQISTNRTRLRPFLLEDVDDAFRVFGDPVVMRYMTTGPDPDRDATRRRIERYLRLQEDRGFSKWAVLDRESGRYLGDSGLTVVEETGEIELGYRLEPASWGKGLATEVARAWLGRAFGVLKLDRLIAFAHPENAPSIRVMEKIGLIFDRRAQLGGMAVVVYAARRGNWFHAHAPMGGSAVREARPSDAASIAGLITDLGYPTSAEEMARRLHGLLADPLYATFVAEDGSRVVGVAGGALARYYEKDGVYARVVVLSVSRESQGLGAGAALVRAVEGWASARGAREIFVNSGNQRAEAHRFYASRGYTQTGIRLVKALEPRG